MRRFALLRDILLSIGLRHVAPPIKYHAQSNISGIFFATGLASALAADPTGDWRVADGCGQHPRRRLQRQHVGRGGVGEDSGGRDINNPDVSKRNRPTLGMPILIDMKKKAGVDQWEGQVYNAKDGQSYSSTIKPVGSDQLEIQGCMLGFLCGGETWTRVAVHSLERLDRHGQGDTEGAPRAEDHRGPQPCCKKAGDGGCD